MNSSSYVPLTTTWSEHETAINQAKQKYEADKSKENRLAFTTAFVAGQRFLKADPNEVTPERRAFIQSMIDYNRSTSTSFNANTSTASIDANTNKPAGNTENSITESAAAAATVNTEAKSDAPKMQSFDTESNTTLLEGQTKKSLLPKIDWSNSCFGKCPSFIPRRSARKPASLDTSAESSYSADLQRPKSG